MTLKFGHLSLVGFSLVLRKKYQRQTSPRPVRKERVILAVPLFLPKTRGYVSARASPSQRVKKCPLRLRIHPPGPTQELREAKREIFPPDFVLSGPAPSPGSALVRLWDAVRTPVMSCRGWRTRRCLYPAHPKPAASIPGSLQTPLSLQGMLGG